MKIVASTKLTRAQRAMFDSRKYGQTSNEVFDSAETKPLESEGKKTLLVVCSSDKGLCGGIHSGLSRNVRKLFADKPGGYDLVIVGEKCKSQLGRSNPKDIVLNFAGVGKDIPTFADAQAIADQIVLLPGDYAEVKIIYNKFLNAQSYEATVIEAFSEEAIAASRASPRVCAAPDRAWRTKLTRETCSQLLVLRDRRGAPRQPARVRPGKLPLLGPGRRPRVRAVCPPKCYGCMSPTTRSDP